MKTLFGEPCVVLTREKNTSVIVHPTLGTCSCYPRVLRAFSVMAGIVFFSTSKECHAWPCLFFRLCCVCQTVLDMCPDMKYSRANVVTLSREVAVEPNYVFFCLVALQKNGVL